MGERGGLPIKEIPALVLDVARAQGWLDPREAESLRSALSAAREEARRLERENESCGLVINDCTARLAASESSARRLREALEDIASDMCATEAVRYDSQKCTDFCVDPAGWCEVCRARAALGSSPVDTKGETT